MKYTISHKLAADDFAHLEMITESHASKYVENCFSLEARTLLSPSVMALAKSRGWNNLGADYKVIYEQCAPVFSRLLDEMERTKLFRNTPYLSDFRTQMQGFPQIMNFVSSPVEVLTRLQIRHRSFDLLTQDLEASVNDCTILENDGPRIDQDNNYHAMLVVESIKPIEPKVHYGVLTVCSYDK